MRSRIAIMAAITALLAVAPAVEAQLSTGRIDVTVTDGTGAILPGVAVSLDRAADRPTPRPTHAARSISSTSRPAPTSSPRSSMASATTRTSGSRSAPASPCRSRSRWPWPACHRRSSRSSPRRRSSTSSVRRRRPTSRSTSCRTSRRRATRGSSCRPCPGVIVDRVNVGGAESGQQSNYQAKGAAGADNTWNIDGIPITDMARARVVADLLRLRHVPGDAGHDRRRRHHERDARRPAELRAEERHEHAARLGAHLLRERGHAGEQHARRPRGHRSAARAARATASSSTPTTAASSAARS